MGVSPTDPHDSAAPPDGVYDRIHDTAEFAELKARYRAFVLPATVGFFLWYLLYVFMSNWAHGFMSKEVFGHINVALIFGLLQFATTFAIAWMYARYMNKSVDPIAEKLEARFQQEVGQ